MEAHSETWSDLFIQDHVSVRQAVRTNLTNESQTIHTRKCVLQAIMGPDPRTVYPGLTGNHQTKPKMSPSNHWKNPSVNVLSPSSLAASDPLLPDSSHFPYSRHMSPAQEGKKQTSWLASCCYNPICVLSAIAKLPGVIHTLYFYLFSPPLTPVNLCSLAAFPTLYRNHPLKGQRCTCQTAFTSFTFLLSMPNLLSSWESHCNNTELFST